MKSTPRYLPLLSVLLLLFGCSESKDSPPAAAPPLPPPQFVVVDDPREFFARFLADLGGETYFPQELAEELTGKTDLATAIRMIERHHTMAFVDWYYAADYLDQVKVLVDQKIERMDYQLKVLRVDPHQAAEVLLITHGGPLEHKQVLQKGAPTEAWQQRDEETYDVHLSLGRWQQLLRLVREEGRWKLGIAARY